MLRRARPWARVLVACLIFLFTGLYRFNTLGGRFGGFENDHFVPFAYAKQVQAGQQPLRDFAGLGLQGAWPSLTYELSALAQEWLGNNLRSEALLTVGGVALAAALTFVAASLLSNMFWAALGTLVSVFVAPTLYNYTKVLPFAAGALAMVCYARRPGIATSSAAAAVTAVAFLFRHDLAVYLGVGIVVACLVRGAGRGLRDAGLYMAITAVLLLPSLIYVQYYDGVISYFRDGLSLSAREAERTPLLQWPSFTSTGRSGVPLQLSTFFDEQQNGGTWLYYVMRLLPIAGVLAVWWRESSDDRDEWRASVLAIAATLAMAAPFLVRGNTAVRLGDVGPLFAILFACLCGEVTRKRHGYTWMRSLGFAAVLVLLVATALSASTVGAIRGQLRTARLIAVADTLERFAGISDELRALPEAAVQDPDVPLPLSLARYVKECTQPSDRIVLMTYQPEMLPFAERLFGAGRLTVAAGYVLNESYQRELVEWWRKESVPIAWVESEAFVDPGSPMAPIVRDYLLHHYTEARKVVLARDRVLRLFIDRSRAPRSSYGEQGLPCLR
jgi:hypothetical protein